MIDTTPSMANIDPDVAEALQQLMSADYRAAKMLYDEFRIGLSPYGRGPSGLAGYLTQGQAFQKACELRDSLTEKLDQLNTLRAGALRERTIAICNALSNFDK